MIRYAFLVFPPFVLGDGFISIMRNHVLASLLASYGEDVYVNPFSFSMLGWHLVALGAVGLVGLILTIITEKGIKCCQGR